MVVIGLTELLADILQPLFIVLDSQFQCVYSLLLFVQNIAQLLQTVFQESHLNLQLGYSHFITFGH